MKYKILDKTNIIEYIYSIKDIKDYFQNDALEVDEIGDGNLNYVFIIKSIKNPKKALILKQAVPYLRCVGEEYPLSKERMTYEIRALKIFQENTNENIPKLYDTNEEMSTVIMQFLDKHIIMREGMISKTTYPKFSEHISTYLAKNLFRTSSLFLDSKEKRELIDKFNSNTELCKLTEDFVFTFAFMEHKTNNESAKNSEIAQALFDDMEFKKGVLELKYKFMTQNDALLHGDLHTGSIMLNKDETFIIDPEFAFVGPFGFDIGALLANLIMSYTSHIALDSEDEYKEWILKTIEEVLIKFQEKFLQLWREQEESSLVTKGFISDFNFGEFRKTFLLNILRDSVGFAACKMARRMYGIAGVADIRDIEDKKIREDAIVMTLEIARAFLKEYKNIKNISDVIDIIKEKTE